MASDWEKDSDLEFHDEEVDDFRFDDADDLNTQHGINEEERFNAARMEIKTKRKFIDNGDVDEFLLRYADVAAKSVTKVKPSFLFRMVQKWPNLLQEVNKDEHNPVFMAIRNTLPALVDYMVSACEDKDTLQAALSNKAPGGDTCLHAALKENLSSNTTRLLIQSASDEALAVQNDHGMTPMHYAVSFNQCDVRAELINLFIERDIKALQKSSRTRQTFLDLRATSGRDFQDNAKVFPQGGFVNERVPDGYSRVGFVSSTAEEREKERRKRKAEEARKKAEEGLKKVAEETKSLLVGESSGKLNTAVRTGNASHCHDPAPNTALKRRSTADFNGNHEQKREKEKGLARPSPKPRGSSNGKDRMPGLLRSSDSLLLKLKLHNMRTRSTEMALSFLYDKNLDDVQISFDYDRLPRDMVWNEFVKRFGGDATSGLRFDSVLQYVMFPRVRVTVKGRRADLEREAEGRQFGKLGRKDMEYFFSWLYQKGVRHIIRVSVEDSGDSGETVHSDQAIQTSLEKFVVENLDWKKTDLDPETILSVSSKVEKASPTQYTEKPGVPEVVQDRQLRELTLKWIRALSHLALNVGEAPDAFAGSVEVTKGDWDTGAEGKISLDALHYDTSAPVKASMDIDGWKPQQKFARQNGSFLDNTVDEFLALRQNQGTLEGLENDVVLALIDDGVDMFDTTSPQSNQILEGKSFDFHGGKVRPPFSSAMGHGTVMASMILRVCPMVKVYPIRLKTYQSTEGKGLNIDAGYAAQAIEAALDKNATIISMSWSIPMTEGDSEAKKRRGNSLLISNEHNFLTFFRAVHAVLEKAVLRGVLMFCATPDRGKFTELDYPSGPWREKFFRIGAARADGTVFHWTPEDGITYVVPGVDVIRDQAATGSFSNPLSGQGIPNRMAEFRETGSSVATALAAGLAAMLIYCVKASILVVKTANNSNNPLLVRLPDNAAKDIAHPVEMKRAFRCLGTVTPNNFVQVWNELDKISEQLENLQSPGSSPETKLEATKAFVDFGQRLWSAAKQEH
ncbi:hypothetical protein NEMBOFW57_009019 [Staphylotrichum longicolle]|uniref:Peptidase S8/S53 domain-containing protein n=1 Tax=Staphylotrichum longicolle TaxID=669026 RepID=A0AAD4ESD6_9PEZI|nr:hypothetical protein NEMBOFW57_009019 [Staphylotrichum longicolle]